MKKFCFNIVAQTSYILIWALDYAYKNFLKLCEVLVKILRIQIARLAVFLMKKIDMETYQEKLDEAAALEQLEQQSTELQLLSSASQLKEHALETGEWTDDHSVALNAIGNALLNDCDWEEDDIHRYLKEVVESGTGLSYERGNDDEYDD